jgi:hypothetical protein
VAFATPASDLGPTDPGDDWDVYLRNVATGTTTLVSVNSRGTDGGNRYSGAPTFSPDGSRLAFESEANDLGPTDTNTCRVKPVQPPDTPCMDVYVRDLATATTSVASVDDAGTDTRPMTVSSDVVFNPANSGQMAYEGWLLGTPGDIYLSTLGR